MESGVDNLGPKDFSSIAGFVGVTGVALLWEGPCTVGVGLGESAGLLFGANDSLGVFAVEGAFVTVLGDDGEVAPVVLATSGVTPGVAGFVSGFALTSASFVAVC